MTAQYLIPSEAGDWLVDLSPGDYRLYPPGMFHKYRGKEDYGGYSWGAKWLPPYLPLAHWLAKRTVRRRDRRNARKQAYIEKLEAYAQKKGERK